MSTKIRIISTYFRKDSVCLQIITITICIFVKIACIYKSSRPAICISLKIARVYKSSRSSVCIFVKVACVYKLSLSSVCIFVKIACVFKLSRSSVCNFFQPPMSVICLRFKVQGYRKIVRDLKPL